MVYRATFQHSEVELACLQLSRGRAVAMKAMRGDKRTETVQVVAATAPCRTLAAPAGGVASPATFQVLF